MGGVKKQYNVQKELTFTNFESEKLGSYIYIFFVNLDDFFVLVFLFIKNKWTHGDIKFGIIKFLHNGLTISPSVFFPKSL